MPKPSRKKNRNAIQSSDEGEAFDLNVSDSSSVAGDHVTGANCPQSEPTIAPTIVAPTPPIPTIPTIGSSRAQDVNYFYSKREIDVKGVMTNRKVCTLCM